MTTLDPSARLTRDQLATALTQEGFPIKTATLTTMATRGNGPPFRDFGRLTVYVWGDALAWAQARCRPGKPQRPGRSRKVAALSQQVA